MVHLPDPGKPVLGKKRPAQERKNLVPEALAPANLAQERPAQERPALARPVPGERQGPEESLALERRAREERREPGERQALGENLVPGNRELGERRALGESLALEGLARARARALVRDLAQDLAQDAQEAARLHPACRVLEEAAPLLVVRVVKVLTTSLLSLAGWTLPPSSILDFILHMCLSFIWASCNLAMLFTNFIWNSKRFEAVSQVADDVVLEDADFFVASRLHTNHPQASSHNMHLRDPGLVEQIIRVLIRL